MPGIPVISAVAALSLLPTWPTSNARDPFAEGMTFQMLRRLRLALEHVELHLFEVSHAFFDEDHLDRTDIGGGVKAPEDNVGHDRVPA